MDLPRSQSVAEYLAIVILNALFAWLAQADYLAGNPLSLSRQRTKHAAARITRYLEPGLWQEVKDTIAALPRDSDRARAHAYRVRWLFTLLYPGGLRIAEVGANTMGQFFVSYCQIWCFGFGMIRRPAVAEAVCCRSPVARL